ncbi:MAG: ATP-grasp domain-containing protein, partial [Bacteriovoracaceae bacterium]
MNIHEYQAKDLMRKYDIAVLNGGVADTPAEAVEVAKKLGGS